MEGMCAQGTLDSVWQSKCDGDGQVSVQGVQRDSVLFM